MSSMSRRRFQQAGLGAFAKIFQFPTYPQPTAHSEGMEGWRADLYDSNLPFFKFERTAVCKVKKEIPDR